MIEMGRTWPLHVVYGIAHRKAVATGFKQHVRLGPFGTWLIEETDVRVPGIAKGA